MFDVVVGVSSACGTDQVFTSGRCRQSLVTYCLIVYTEAEYVGFSTALSRWKKNKS
jgi:hypothetical protein